VDANARKDAVRRFVDLAWNQGRLDEARATMAERFVNHTALDPNETRDATLERIQAMRVAFPDVRMSIEDLVAEGDRVAARFRLEGTHEGPFRGLAPTGRRVSVVGMAIDRFEGGERVEGWALLDVAGLMAQLKA